MTPTEKGTDHAVRNYLRHGATVRPLDRSAQHSFASSRPRMPDSTATPPRHMVANSLGLAANAQHDSSRDGDDSSALPPSLRLIVDTLVALGDAVIVTTRDGTIIHWTSAAEALLGWRHVDTIGRSLIALLDPTPADVAAPLHLSLLGETQWQGPAVVRKPGDDTLTVHLSLTQLAPQDAGTNDPSIVLRVRAWPERARPTNPRTLDPDVFRRALEHVEDIVLISAGSQADPGSSRIVYVNEAFERTTGFRRDEVIGRSPVILRGPDTDRDASERIDAATRDRQRVREEILNYTKQGEPLWLDVDIIPIDGDTGSYMQWVAIERDVSSRKGQEVALRAREERLRLALSAVWDGLWDWHVPTGYCYYAPRWYSMLGFAEHTLPPHIDTFLDLLHPQDLPACEQALRDHFDGRTDKYAIEVRLRTAHNTWCWVLRAAPSWNATAMAAPCAWSAPTPTSPNAKKPNSPSAPAKIDFVRSRWRHHSAFSSRTPTAIAPLSPQECAISGVRPLKNCSVGDSWTLHIPTIARVCSRRGRRPSARAES